SAQAYAAGSTGVSGGGCVTHTAATAVSGIDQPALPWSGSRGATRTALSFPPTIDPPTRSPLASSTAGPVGHGGTGRSSLRSPMSRPLGTATGSPPSGRSVTAQPSPTASRRPRTGAGSVEAATKAGAGDDWPGAGRDRASKKASTV